MTVSVFAQHKVDDFATWKELYDKGAQLRKESNVVADSVYRDPNDPNMFIVQLQFAEVSAAKAQAARLDSDEFRAFIKSMGIHIENLGIWIGEAV
jgi:hypothetical protein